MSPCVDVGGRGCRYHREDGTHRGGCANECGPVEDAAGYCRRFHARRKAGTEAIERRAVRIEAMRGTRA